MSAKRGPVLLASKLQAPISRPDAVDRPHLVQILEDAPAAALRAIVAPTGWGKSQLLAQWLTARGGPIAYVGIDSLDNDATRLWAHIVSAVATATGIEAEDLLNALRAPALPIVAEIVEPLLERITSTPLTLVLEDLHELDTPETLESVELMIDKAPPTATVAIVSRSDPAMRLSRRRIAGDLVEIRLDDLRLDRDGAAAVIAAISDTSIDLELIDRLVSRTEGWPAGVSIAALSLRGATDTEAVVDRFAGDDRLLGEYLATEVLSGFSADDQAFMLATAVLTELQPTLCDELIGRTDSAQRLAELSRSNLFLIPADHTATRFRYHQLFGEWLRLELDRSNPAALGNAHRRAAHALRSSGQHVKAVSHALATGDPLLGFEFVAGSALTTIDSGAHSTVADWLAQLPDDLPADMIVDRAVLRAWTGIIDGDLDTVDRNCRIAQNHIRDDLNTLIDLAGPGEIHLLQSYAHLLRGSINGSIASAAAARTAGLSDRTEATLIWLDAANGYWAGTPDEDAFLDTIAKAVAVDDPYAVILADAYLAHIALDRLEPDAAVSWVDAAFEQADANGLASFGHLSLAHAARARLELLAGAADEAVAAAARAIELAERRGDTLAASLARIISAEAHHSAGQRDHARRQLAVVRSDIDKLTNPGTLTERLRVAERQLRLPPRGSFRRSPDLPVEPLTDREMALLRLLPGDLSQRELARVLHVSFNTVKTYNRQIYRKLGVASRDDAVAAARAGGLL